MGATLLLTCAALLGTAAAPPALTEEAVLADGRRLTGSLILRADGELAFRTVEGLLRLEQVHQVRVTTPVSPGIRGRGVHRVLLPGGQQLTGALRDLDGDSLHLQPDWLDKPIMLPRSAVVALTHVPRRVTVFDEDFADDLRFWKGKGQPTLTDRQQPAGRQSLLLDSPGQSVEYRPARPIESGRLLLSYRADSAAPLGARWLAEAEFEGIHAPRRVSVEVAGGGFTFVRAAPGLETEARAVFRPTGWHRLSIDFAADGVCVQVDDQVLHRSSDRGPGGPLRKVRLACVAGPVPVLVGAAWFTDVLLERTVADWQPTAADASQDELLLLEGDQLFGEVLRADRRRIVFKARFGQRTFDWSEVRSLSLRRQTLASRSTEGEHVRVWLRPDDADELGPIEGVVRGLDSRRLILEHSLLGRLAIDRAGVRQLQPLMRGRRIELNHAPYHLGQRVLPGLTPARPDGPSLRRTFTLDAVPLDARLVVETAHLQSPADGLAVAQALERGSLRTEVVLNGRVVDYLNRHAGRSSAPPQRLNLALPRQALRNGENVLELRQTLDPDTGRSADCTVSALVIEIPK